MLKKFMSFIFFVVFMMSFMTIGINAKETSTIEEVTPLLNVDFESQNHGVGTQFYGGMFIGKVEENAKYGFKNSGVFTITDGTMFTNNSAFKNPMPQLNFQTNTYYTSRYVTAEADLYSENTNVPLNFSVYYKYNDDITTSYNIYLKRFSNGDLIEINGKRVMPFEEKRWYKIAVSFDMIENIISTYVDGELVKSENILDRETERDITGAGGRFRIAGTYASIETEGGWTVGDVYKNSLKAIDNMRLYEAVYNPAQDLPEIDLSTSEVSGADDEFIYIHSGFMPITAGKLKELVGDVTVYADDTFAKILTDNEMLNENSRVISKSLSGEVYKIYKIKEDKLLLVTGDDGMIYARSPYAYNKAEEYILCLAEYDGDSLENLAFKMVGGENEGNTTEPFVYDRTKTYKAFFWTNGLKAVCDSVSTKAIPVLKVLAIGNSFSEDAMSYLYQIAKAEGVNLSLANAYIGGCSIDGHYKKAQNGEASYTYQHISDKTLGQWIKDESKTLEYCLKAENWDVITVQQASGSSGREDTYSKIGDLVEWINANKTNPNARLGWHLTWAYQSDCTLDAFSYYSNDQMTMYNSIVGAVKSKVMPMSEFDFIIPSGTMVQNLRTSFLGDTVTRDGYHMSIPLGRYAVGLTWYKMITGNDIDDITYVPTSTITEEQIKAVKECVNNALAVPYEVTQSKFNYTKEKKLC